MNINVVSDLYLYAFFLNDKWYDGTSGKHQFNAYQIGL
jgi:hypothetical protein